jgi:hypothetical protein
MDINSDYSQGVGVEMEKACFIPDYSRCVGVKIEKSCFDWGIVPSLWFRQFTHDVN